MLETSANSHFEQNYQSHLKHLKLKGLQPKTIDAYSRAVRRVEDRFDKQIDNLSESQLTDYFSELVASHSWSTVKLYADDLQQSTVEREYLTCLMLGIAPTSNLLPTQTYCLYLILRNFNECYRCAGNHDTKLPFVMDTATGLSPQRALGLIKARPGVRFFGFGDARVRLESLRHAAHASNQLPEWVQASRIDIDRYRALLDTLLEHWSDEPPQRRSRRERQVATIIVTHGFGRVYRMLACSKYAKEGKQLNYVEHMRHDATVFRGEFGSVGDEEPGTTTEHSSTPLEILRKFELAGDRAMTEQWTLVDASEGGLGAVAEKHGGWLRAGMLIGFRYHDSIEWRIATVRRLARTPQGKLGVGLKFQQETASCGRLRVNNTNPDDIWIAPGKGVDPFVNAILVGGAQPLLIVESGVYAPNRECLMRLGDAKQDIRLEQLIERGVHFECISFSAIEVS